MNKIIIWSACIYNSSHCERVITIHFFCFLIQRCGNIVSWKRVQGADGKLQAFGFCEFEVPEATLRCIRLLNEWPIAEKKIVVS